MEKPWFRQEQEPVQLTGNLDYWVESISVMLGRPVYYLFICVLTQIMNKYHETD